MKTFAQANTSHSLVAAAGNERTPMNANTITLTRDEVMSLMLKNDFLSQPGYRKLLNGDSIEVNLDFLTRVVNVIGRSTPSDSARSGEGAAVSGSLRADLMRLSRCLQMNASTIDAIDELGPQCAGDEAWQIMHNNILPALAAAQASPAVAAEADLNAVYDLFQIGSQARSIGGLLNNIRNTKHFMELLLAVEREFFMVPGEPDDEFPDDESDDECLVNSWGSTKEEYIEQFRAALGKIAAAALTHQAAAPEVTRLADGYESGFFASSPRGDDGQFTLHYKTAAQAEAAYMLVTSIIDATMAAPKKGAAE